MSITWEGGGEDNPPPHRLGFWQVSLISGFPEGRRDLNNFIPGYFELHLGDTLVSLPTPISIYSRRVGDPIWGFGLHVGLVMV